MIHNIILGIYIFGIVVSWPRFVKFLVNNTGYTESKTEDTEYRGGYIISGGYTISGGGSLRKNSPVGNVFGGTFFSLIWPIILGLYISLSTIQYIIDKIENWKFLVPDYKKEELEKERLSEAQKILREYDERNRHTSELTRRYLEQSDIDAIEIASYERNKINDSDSYV